MLIDDEELALPYSGFPWFDAATINATLLERVFFDVMTLTRPSSEEQHSAAPLQTLCPSSLPIPRLWLVSFT
jgi:hypothetical protein